jgi:hypothetical protein
MTNKIGLTLFTAGLFAATALFVPYAPSVAQERSSISTELSAQQQQQQQGQKNAAPQRAAPQGAVQQRATPQRAIQQRATPQRAVQQRAVPQRAVQQRAVQQRIAPQRTVPRTIATPRRTPSHTVTQPKITPRVARQPKTTPSVVAPAGTGRKVASPATAPRAFTPHGTRTVTGSRLRGVPTRGAGRTVIRGQNYSTWRSGHRVRHGNSWRTFVALSALGAIAIGSSEFYPYAYISAPEPYCEGLTEDGCELVWQQVETIEGDVIDQCVAYCPWQ